MFAMATHGFDNDGIRLGSEITWRFASFVFFAAVAAGPVCRLVPLDVCKRLDAVRRQLIWSFCASYAVFLASLLLPNSVGGVTHDDATAGMILFSLFGGLAMAVLAYAASLQAAARVGEKVAPGIAVGCGFLFLAHLCVDGPGPSFRAASSRRVLWRQPEPDDHCPFAALCRPICRKTSRNFGRPRPLTAPASGY